MKSLQITDKRIKLKQMIVSIVLVGIGASVLLTALLIVKIIRSAPDVSEIDINTNGHYTSFVYSDRS